MYFHASAHVPKLGLTTTQERRIGSMKYDESKKKLKIRVNFWPPDARRLFEGAIVHPAEKSKRIDFRDAKVFVEILKDLSKADVKWDEPSKTIKPVHKGLTFFLVLEPYIEIMNCRVSLTMLIIQCGQSVSLPIVN